MQKMKELTEQEAYQKAAAICAVAENCQADIMSKLKKWGLSYDVAETVVNRLVENSFIDEARYARCFVSDKFRYNKWGRLKIRQALKIKKIPEEAINEAFAVIDEDSYDQTILALIKAKANTTKGEKDYAYRCKLMRFAVGRGFEPERVSAQIGKILHGEENEVWEDIDY